MLGFPRVTRSLPKSMHMQLIVGCAYAPEVVRRTTAAQTLCLCLTARTGRGRTPSLHVSAPPGSIMTLCSPVMASSSTGGRGRRTAGPREGVCTVAHAAHPPPPPGGLPDPRLAAQQGHERPGDRGESRRGLRQRPAPPGYTMARYGHSRKDGARRLAASGADRLSLSSLL